VVIRKPTVARSNVREGASNPQDRVESLAAALQIIPPGQLRTAFPELSVEDAEYWEREFAPLRRPCGCIEAVGGAVIALSAASVAYALLPSAFPTGWVVFLLLISACGAAGIAIGKSLGIVRARHKYLRTVQRFQTEALIFLKAADRCRSRKGER
jgi:hypothetical protein